MITDGFIPYILSEWKKSWWRNWNVSQPPARISYTSAIFHQAPECVPRHGRAEWCCMCQESKPWNENGHGFFTPDLVNILDPRPPPPGVTSLAVPIRCFDAGCEISRGMISWVVRSISWPIVASIHDRNTQKYHPWIHTYQWFNMFTFLMASCNSRKLSPYNKLVEYVIIWIMKQYLMLPENSNLDRQRGNREQDIFELHLKNRRTCATIYEGEFEPKSNFLTISSFKSH